MSSTRIAPASMSYARALEIAIRADEIANPNIDHVDDTRDVEAIAQDMIREGATLVAVGKRCGRSEKWAARIRNDMGLTRTNEIKAEHLVLLERNIRELHAEGASDLAIGRQLGLDGSYIRTRRVSYGLAANA